MDSDNNKASQTHLLHFKVVMYITFIYFWITWKHITFYVTKNFQKYPKWMDVGTYNPEEVYI